eukprot:gene1813-2035_t
MAHNTTSPNGQEKGYIHSLGNIRKSKRNYPFYRFALQTSPTKTRAVVGYNVPAHQQLEEFQKSKSSIMLKNIATDDTDKETIIFNQSLSANILPKIDIDFDYAPTSSFNIDALQHKPTVQITLDMIEKQPSNQRINVIAACTLGKSEPKFSFRGDILVQRLVVKCFKGAYHICNTTESTFEQQEEKVTGVKGTSLLENPECEMHAEEIAMVRKLNIYLACQTCKKKIVDTSRNKVKCFNCNSSQRARDCCREASCQIQVKDADLNPIWLTVYTDQLSQILSLGKGISLESDTETIENFLFDVTNISFMFNKNNRVLTKIITSTDDK